MTLGWFDAFREYGAPTWFGENRTPVYFDFQIAFILSLFIIPILAYLTIAPGIRTCRCVSTVSFLLSMTVGAIILVTIHYPSWHTGGVQIYTVQRAFTDAKFNATLGVKIGLKHVNITLASVPVPKHKPFSLFSLIMDDHVNTMYYNERFDFTDVSSMERELVSALHKGLPYPILKVIEYLSVDRAGFMWGRQYRLAGYYTFVILWLAFACWLLQMVMLCLVPHYFGKVSVLVGVTTLIGNLVYATNTPSNLVVRFSNPDDTLTLLTFSPSYSFYATLIAGLASVVYGGGLWILQSKMGYRFVTVFSARIDEMCGLERPISMPAGCPADLPPPPRASSNGVLSPKMPRSVSGYKNMVTFYTH